MKQPISEVYNEDCMAGMARCPDKYFELAVVDPPYGIGVSKMDMGIGKSPRCSKAKNRKWKPKKWDDEAPDHAPLIHPPLLFF